MNSRCGSCGGVDELCCVGSQCDDSLTCFPGWVCKPCGFAFESCCPRFDLPWRINLFRWCLRVVTPREADPVRRGRMRGGDARVCVRWIASALSTWRAVIAELREKGLPSMLEHADHPSGGWHPSRRRSASALGSSAKDG